MSQESKSQIVIYSLETKNNSIFLYRENPFQEKREDYTKKDSTKKGFLLGWYSIEDQLNENYLKNITTLNEALKLNNERIFTKFTQLSLHYQFKSSKSFKKITQLVEETNYLQELRNCNKRKSHRVPINNTLNLGLAMISEPSLEEIEKQRLELLLK